MKPELYTKEIEAATQLLRECLEKVKTAKEHLDAAATLLVRPEAPSEMRSWHPSAIAADAELQRLAEQFGVLAELAKAGAKEGKSIDATCDRLDYAVRKLYADIMHEADQQRARDLDKQTKIPGLPS